MPDVQIDPGIKASEATVELHKIHEGLKLAHSTIEIIHGPISELLVVITRIDQYVGDALSFLNFTDDILAILHDAIKFCQYLGELIPEVGPILAEAASFIENLHIEQTVKAIVDEVRTVVKEAKDVVLNNLKRVVTPIATHLTSIRDELPTWVSTLGTMFTVSRLVDWLLFEFFHETSDDIVKEILKKLKDVSGAAGTAFDAVSLIFDVIKTAIKEGWETFRDAVIKPIEHGIGATLEAMRPVMDIVKKCMNVCGTIKGWFEPFFWVLDCVQWLWEHTVGWLIDKVMNELGIKKWIADFVQTIEDKLGITALKDEIKEFLVHSLQSVYEAFTNGKIGSDGQGVMNSLNAMRSELQQFRADPAGSLFTVVSTGKWTFAPVLAPKLTALVVQGDKVDADGFGNWAERRQEELDKLKANKTPVVVLLAVPRSADMVRPTSTPPVPGLVRAASANPPSLKLEVVPAAVETPDENAVSIARTKETVKKVQTTMGDFINLTGITKPDDTPVPSSRARLFVAASGTTEARPPPKTPKLTYAIHNELPVSITMRVVHDPATAARDSARSTEAPALDPLPSSYTTQKPQIADPSKFHAAFADFDDKFDAITSVIKDAMAALNSLQVVAKAADKLFGHHDDDLKDLSNHVYSLVKAMRPALDDVDALMQLPLSYRTALTTGVKPMLDYIVGGDVIATGIGHVLGAIDDVKGTIDSVIKSTAAMLDAAEKPRTGTETTGLAGLEVAYAAMHAHADKINSPARFPKTLGPDVKDLDSFIVMIKRRLETELNCLTFTHALGQVVVHHSEPQHNNEKPRIDSATYVKLAARLRSVYEVLDPHLTDYITQLKEIRPITTKFDAALRVVYADIQDFYAGISKMTEQCRNIEAKLIAIDHVNGVAKRINVAVGPFESILKDLNVKKDTNGTTPAPAPVANPVTGDTSAMQKVLNTLPTIALDVLKLMVQSFFEMDEVEKEIDAVIDLLHVRSENDLNTIDSCLAQLIDLAQPKNKTSYTFTSGQSTNTIQLANPLLSDDTANQLQDIFKELSSMAVGMSIPGDVYRPDASPDQKRLALWARPDVNGQPVIDMQLLTSAQIWDDEHAVSAGSTPVVPAVPLVTSKPFLDWYDCLVRIDRLVEKGEYSKLVAKVSSTDPPPRGHGGTLWELGHGLNQAFLEFYAIPTLGQQVYRRSVRDVLRAPIFARAEQLMLGQKSSPDLNIDGLDLIAFIESHGTAAIEAAADPKVDCTFDIPNETLSILSISDSYKEVGDAVAEASKGFKPILEKMTVANTPNPLPSLVAPSTTDDTPGRRAVRLLKERQMFRGAGFALRRRLEAGAPIYEALARKAGQQQTTPVDACDSIDLISDGYLVTVSQGLLIGTVDENAAAVRFNHALPLCDTMFNDDDFVPHLKASTRPELLEEYRVMRKRMGLDE